MMAGIRYHATAAHNAFSNEVDVWDRICGKSGDMKGITGIVVNVLACLPTLNRSGVLITEQFKTFGDTVNLFLVRDSVKNIFCKDKSGKWFHQRVWHKKASQVSFAVGGAFSTYKWTSKVGLTNLRGIAAVAVGKSNVASVAFPAFFALGCAFMAVDSLQEAQKSSQPIKATSLKSAEQAAFDKKKNWLTVACNVASAVTLAFAAISVATSIVWVATALPYIALATEALKFGTMYYKAKYDPSLVKSKSPVFDGTPAAKTTAGVTAAAGA